VLQWCHNVVTVVEGADQGNLPARLLYIEPQFGAEIRGSPHQRDIPGTLHSGYSGVTVVFHFFNSGVTVVQQL
jgi:hypothetical protein